VSQASCNRQTHKQTDKQTTVITPPVHARQGLINHCLPTCGNPWVAKKPGI